MFTWECWLLLEAHQYLGMNQTHSSIGLTATGISVCDVLQDCKICRMQILMYSSIPAIYMCVLAGSVELLTDGYIQGVNHRNLEGLDSVPALHICSSREKRD